MFVGLFMVQRWLDGHPDVAPLLHCLGQMEKLERASGPADDAQAQQRRALEVYVAGRFGETISDPAVWSHWYAKNLFTENLAEDCRTSRGGPS